jgi:hypothetical protein
MAVIDCDVQGDLDFLIGFTLEPSPFRPGEDSPLSGDAHCFTLTFFLLIHNNFYLSQFQ